MKKVLSLFLTLALLVSLAACASGNSASTVSTQTQSSDVEKANVFKIGSIGPVTGGAAVYGQAVKNAIQIAVDEVNSNGGINGYQIEYVFQDDEHDTEKSVNAYNALKDWGMQILIATVTSTPCMSVADKSYKDNMFQITPSGSAVECTLNPNVFRMCFSDPNQGIASAQYIDSNNLAKKIGVIYDSSDVYSTGVYEKFLQESKGKNYEIVAEEQFTADSKTDFTTQLTKIKAAGADLVFLPFYYNEAALVLKQADSMEYKPIFFGCDGMDGILNLENFDKQLAEGLILLTPFISSASDDLTKNFVNTYKARYNGIPNQFAADGYDCVYAVKLAAEKANINPSMSVKEICEALKPAMTTITMQGLTGDSISWEADGEPNKTPKAVVIKNGEYVDAVNR